MKLKRRVPFYELASIGGSVRLFDKKIFLIKGIAVVDKNTGTLRKLSDIYYQIRTVQDKKGKVVAKRKCPQDELLAV